MKITRGYIHPETKRVAITVAEWSTSDMNGEECAFLFNPEAERDGMECWRMVDGVDKHITGSIYDMWFYSGSIPKVVSGDAIIFVQANHYKKYFNSEH